METTNSGRGAGGVTATRTVAADGGRLPRERLKHHGVDALRDYELMAIVLGTGYRGHGVLEVARSVVEAHPCEQLLSMDVQELAQLKGMGVALFLRRPSLGCGLLEVPVPESIPSFRLNVDS